jgi:uncharacterized protein
MPNRLAGETSPYLLQHRDNPVDWYPWGEEAMARARREERPILLSIGYSACHWCHVMERESFEDEATARVMNEHFVNIKVDREERPDIDSIYMAAVQQMTGHGGWPMTMFLMPDGTPFYGGTYFPPAPRHGLPSFQQVLLGVSQAYRERRAQVEESARSMLESLRESTQLRPPPAELGPTVLDGAYAALAAKYDPRSGGFGGAPKFPQPMVLEFLLRYWRRTGTPGALGMAVDTLRAMARGGMYDQVGGGFHRYSVDAEWLVPHFEKMLYDNALLARVYLHAHLVAGDAEMRRVLEEILAFLLREMRSDEGGFHSAQDADSEGEEGRFYVWTAAEVDEVLGPEDAPIFRAFYDIEPGGNWEGQSIPRVLRSVDEHAAAEGMAAAELGAVLERSRRALYEHRALRVRPGLDDKVLTAWNAMTIHTFAEAGAALGEREWVEAAAGCAEFLLGTLRRDGRLLRTYRAGAARIGAFLEDHALLCGALLALYEATFDARWVSEARTLADAMLEHFWDADEQRFYDTPGDGESLVVRPRDVFDNATPSGNSASVAALLRLTELTGEPRYETVARAVLEQHAPLMGRYPQAFGELLGALAFHLAPPRELAIVGEREAPGTAALLAVVRTGYRPEVVVAHAEPGDTAAAAAVPLLADRPLVRGEPAAYVCRRFACRQPVTTPAALAAELDSAG